MVAALDKVASVRGALSPSGASWHQGGSAMVLAIPASEVGTSHGGTSLADVRHTVPRGDLVGGDAAQTVDETSATYGAFPLMFGLVALVTFVLLARGLRSILLPAKAVLLNALSVAAAYGLIVLVFQHGLGSHALWGMSATGSIDTYVPLLMFGFLFGISMDYEVFILSRVREAYNRVRSTDGGIVEGVSRTGRLVTSAALILCLALASLSTAQQRHRPGARLRTRRRGAARCRRGAHAAVAGAGVAVRGGQLVAAAPGKAAAAHTSAGDQASPVGSGARAQGR